MAKAKKASNQKRVAPSSPTSGFMYNLFPNPPASSKKSSKKK